jgi:hypothetical protein
MTNPSNGSANHPSSREPEATSPPSQASRRFRVKLRPSEDFKFTMFKLSTSKGGPDKVISRFTDAAEKFCEQKTGRRKIRRVDITDIAAFDLTLAEWSTKFNDTHQRSGVILWAGETEVYGRGPEFKITVLDDGTIKKSKRDRKSATKGTTL